MYAMFQNILIYILSHSFKLNYFNYLFNDGFHLTKNLHTFLKFIKLNLPMV